MRMCATNASDQSLKQKRDNVLMTASLHLGLTRNVSALRMHTAPNIVRLRTCS